MTSALKAQLSISFSPAAAQTLEAFASPLIAAAYAPHGTLEADLLILPDAQRVTITRKGRPALTVVFRSSGRHSFWDHNLRAYVDFSRTPPPLRVQPPQNLDTKTVDKPNSVFVEMASIDAAAGAIRHEPRRCFMSFTADPDAMPFPAFPWTT
jgi:hypothetical protein